MFSVSRMIVVLLFYVHGKLLRVMSGWSVNLTTRTVSKRYGTNKGPIWDFIWVLYGHPIWDWDGICNTVTCGTHMGKPIWVTNGNHMGPILDLA